MTNYQTRLTESEIAAEEYKKLLGGGSQLWSQRGAAQLDFLIHQGLLPGSRLLDIGCGPLRAGTFFIKFLNQGNYTGFDSNESFIDAAEKVVAQNRLEHKKPRIFVARDFQVEHSCFFDFGIAFSVLNHCKRNERLAFFRNIAAAFRPSASIFVSHGRWYKRSYLSDSKLRLQRMITSPLEARSFDHAWTDYERLSLVFPILQFTI